MFFFISLNESKTILPACESFASAATVLFPCLSIDPPIRTILLTDFINFSPPIETAKARFVNGPIAHVVISF